MVATREITASTTRGGVAFIDDLLANGKGVGEPVITGYNASTKTISGTGYPAATVTVYDRGFAIGTATVDANGDWTLTLAAGLDDTTLTATQVYVPVSNPATSVIQTSPVGRTFLGNSSSLYILGPVEPGNLLAGASVITLLARVRPTNTTGNRTAIGIDIGGTSGPSLGLAATNLVRAGARSTTADTFQTKTGTSQLSINTWHTIAAVINFAAGTMDVYADGVLNTSGSNAATFGATALTVGTTFSLSSKIGNNPPSSEGFVGEVADVAIYPRSLSAAEILSVHQGARPNELTAGDPALYWPLTGEIDGVGSFAKGLIGGVEGVPITAPAYASASRPSGLVSLASRPETKFRSTRTLRIKGRDASAGGPGSGVSSVKMTGGPVAVQATPANQPTYLATASGAIRFTAASSQYLSAEIGKVDFKRGVTVVALLDARADGRVLGHAASATNDLTNSYCFTPTNGLMIGGASGLCYSNFTDYTVNSTGKALMSGRYSGVEIANWLNGVRRVGTVSGGTARSNGDVRLTVTNPNALTSQPLQIGRRLASSALYWDGDLYDAIVVHGNLTDEEVAYYEGVIAWDNDAVALLPAGHPWKNEAPTATSRIDYPWGPTMVARSPLPASSFVGSPCLIKGSDGLFYATHDYFNSTLDNTGRLLVSRNGRDWNGLASFSNFQWATIWEHTDGNLYILALTRAYGDIKIGKSTDRGKTWTFNTISKTGGPLTAAGAGMTAPNYHRAGGVTHLYHDGHIFFAFENQDPGTSPAQFKSGVLYIASTDDLMDETKWKTTSQLAIGSTAWAGVNVGMLEGNMVVDGTGQIYNILRFGYSTDGPNHAVFIPIGWDGTTATMPSWSSGFVKDLPGGNVKFQFVQDDNYLWSLTNQNVALAGGVGGNTTDERDRVTLIRSQYADLSSPSFAVASVVIDQTTLGNGLSASDQTLYSGFQYPSLILDGDEFAALYRVSWSGADTYHNSNFIGAGRVAKLA